MAVRAVLRPRRSTVLAPVGERRASWSKVRASPPALRMRARAPAVKCSAATRSLGTSNKRVSSVTVPTTTPMVPSFLLARLTASLEVETGGRLTRLMHRRWSTSLLNLEFVRRARKRYSCGRRKAGRGEIRMSERARDRHWTRIIHRDYWSRRHEYTSEPGSEWVGSDMRERERERTSATQSTRLAYHRCTAHTTRASE